MCAMARGEKRSFELRPGVVLRLRVTRRGEAGHEWQGDPRTLTPAVQERASWLAKTHTGCGSYDVWYELLFPWHPEESPCGPPSPRRS